MAYISNKFRQFMKLKFQFQFLLIMITSEWFLVMICECQNVRYRPVSKRWYRPILLVWLVIWSPVYNYINNKFRQLTKLRISFISYTNGLPGEVVQTDFWLVWLVSLSPLFGYISHKFRQFMKLKFSYISYTNGLSGEVVPTDFVSLVS